LGKGIVSRGNNLVDCLVDSIVVANQRLDSRSTKDETLFSDSFAMGPSLHGIARRCLDALAKYRSPLEICGNKTGHVRITNEGKANIGNWLEVGDADTTTGIGLLEVDGQGSELVVKNHATVNGNAELNISDRAVAKFHSRLKVGDAKSTAIPRLALNGGAHLEVNSRLEIGPKTNAIADIGAGTTVTAAQVRIGQYGILTGAGIITSSVENRGTIKIGMDDAMSIVGPLEQEHGVLQIEVRGEICGTLLVSQQATLAGTLSFVIDAVTPPVPGRRYVILQAKSIKGQFANVVAADGSQLEVDVDYSATDVTLIFGDK
jgi:hypothetical protein